VILRCYRHNGFADAQPGRQSDAKFAHRLRAAAGAACKIESVTEPAYVGHWHTLPSILAGKPASYQGGPNRHLAERAAIKTNGKKATVKRQTALGAKGGVDLWAAHLTGLAGLRCESVELQLEVDC